MPSYLGYHWRPVPVAGDVHNERPVVGMHEDASRLGTGGVECRGTAAVGALHAAAVHLPLHPLPAVHTLLHEVVGGGEGDRDTTTARSAGEVRVERKEKGRKGSNDGGW